MFQQQQEVHMSEADEIEFIEYQVIDIRGTPLSKRYPSFTDVQNKAFEILKACNWSERIFILVIDTEYGPLGDQEVFVA